MRRLFGHERTRCEIGADLGGLVAQDGDERRDAEQLRRRVAVARGPLAQSRAAGTHRRRGRGVVQAGDDGAGFELERECGIAAVERRGCAIQHLDRRSVTLGAVECARKDSSRARSGLRVGCGIHRALQVLGPPVEAGARFGDP